MYDGICSHCKKPALASLVAESYERSEAWGAVQWDYYPAYECSHCCDAEMIEDSGSDSDNGSDSDSGDDSYELEENEE